MTRYVSILPYVLYLVYHFCGIGNIYTEKGMTMNEGAGKTGEKNRINGKKVASVRGEVIMIMEARE